MTAQDLTLTAAVVDEVITETAAFGSARLETGGFLMASAGSNAVCSVAMAGDAGIVRTWNQFQISDQALDRLFSYADSNQLWLPIQFHSHQFDAGMSRTDAQHGLRVEGFISAILPTFAHPPDAVGEWNWWQFTSGRWRGCPPPVVVPAPVSLVVSFDEGGVRER
jgi:hypothetical protein